MDEAFHEYTDGDAGRRMKGREGKSTSRICVCPVSMNLGPTNEEEAKVIKLPPGGRLVPGECGHMGPSGFILYKKGLEEDNA